jgi:hypothetical protein
MPTQKYLINSHSLVISSPKKDTIRYTCTESALDKTENISYGINSLEVIKDCHYETSELQIRNKMIHSAELTQDSYNSPLDIIQSLNNINSLLDNDRSESANFTALRQKLLLYGKNIISEDQTIDEIALQVQNLDLLRTLTEFSPTTLDLSRPFHTSNWMAAIFWTLIILAIVLFWSVIRHFSWYKTKVAPKIVSVFSYATKFRCSCKKAEPISNQHNTTNLAEASIPLMDLNAVQPQTIENQNLNTSEPEYIPDWNITRSQYQNFEISAQIILNTELFSLSYNPTTDQLFCNRILTHLNFRKPGKNLITSYYGLLSSSDCSPSVRDNSGNIIHAKYANLHYFPSSNQWFDVVKNTKVWGLTPPAAKILDNSTMNVDKSQQ